MSALSNRIKKPAPGESQNSGTGHQLTFTGISFPATGLRGFPGCNGWTGARKIGRLKNKGNVLIKGKRIGLRHLVESDIELFARAASDPALRGEFLPTRMKSPQAVRKKWNENGFSSDDSETLLICDENGRVIGDVSHVRARPYSTCRELGWSIYEPADRGVGYGGDAIATLVDYLFVNWQINRLECCLNPMNMASRRVAEKAGFVKEGNLKEVVFFNAEFRDLEIYGLLRSVWHARRQLA